MKTIASYTSKAVAVTCAVLVSVALFAGCSSSHAKLVPADVLAAVEQALQPDGKITHLTAHDERGVDVEVWLDSANDKARADSVTNGHRISEIITAGRTYDQIPSLSSANTPDEALSLALPWFVATEQKYTPAVQSSTVERGRANGTEVLVINEVTDDGIQVPYTIWPTDSPLCPLDRTLTVNASSYLPMSLDVTLLCRQKHYPMDYQYHVVYSSIEFLDRDSPPELWFSPEVVRSQILSEELVSLRSSEFQVYWLGSELPDDLKITPDDGLDDARAGWLSPDGEVAYFDYSQLHSSPGGLRIYEWPRGELGLFCTTEWPVSWTKDVTTKFGQALFCEAQEKQLVFVAGNTMIRLEYSLNGPDWLIARANALIPLE